MAVYKKMLNGIEVKIHNVDHPPPHCHMNYNQKDVKINLITQGIMNSPPNKIPVKISKTFSNELAELRQAWKKVRVIPTGGSPGNW